MEEYRKELVPTLDAAEIVRFRERVRILERRLGLLDLMQSECCGLSLSQCHALVEIGRSSPLSLGELSQRLELDKSTMSRVVDSLVSSGNVNRKEHPHDRRLVQLTLTDAGRAKFERIEQEMQRQFSMVFSSIPREKRAQVLESIDVLLQSLPNLRCCGGAL
ncbi:MAG: MarR family transcriptional regulator [Spirochaetes bacterium]|nr:MarR family transcriptional regulator [Spirochaetota bacterium]